MIGNACLSQPRNYSRDMVVEPAHSVSVLGSITFCLLDVSFLGVEELFYLIFFAACRFPHLYKPLRSKQLTAYSS
jgi:hypothetical protein